MASSEASSGSTEQLGFAGMPAQLFVCTPAKLATYEDCPRRYRMTYLDRPTPPKGPPWAHLSVGASIHLALRNWWLLPDDQRTPAAAAELLAESWISQGFRNDVQEEGAKELATAWLMRYVSEADTPTQPDTAADASTRPSQPVGVERIVAIKTGSLAFSGRIDRLDRRGDALVIVDYKTGRSKLSADDARSSPALALYALAASRTLRRACHRVELHHVPTSEIHAHEHTDASLARHLTRAENTAMDITGAEKALRDGSDPDIAFPPQPTRRCGWCDFRGSCVEGQQASSPVEPWSGLA